MKYAFLSFLITVNTFSSANAAFMGRVEQYLDSKTGSLVEISTRDIPKTDMTNLSKSTKKEIAGVKASRNALIDNRLCKILYLFENKQAIAECHLEPNYVIVDNVEKIIPEVGAMNGFHPDQTVKISNEKESNKNRFHIISVFANGQAIIQRESFKDFQTANIFKKTGLYQIELSALEQID